MMNSFRRIVLFLCCLMLSLVRAQGGAVDSLRQLIPSLQGPERSNAYFKLQQLLISEGDEEALLECMDEWIAYEAEHGNEEFEGKARWNKVSILSNASMDSLLLEEAPKQMEWFLKHHQLARYYDAWDSKASVYFYSYHIQTALREAQSMLNDANKRDNSVGRAIAYQLMGLIYESMSQYEQAIGMFNKSIELLKTLYEKNNMSTTAYDYLCQTLDAAGKYEEELKIADEWEDCFRERIKPDSKLTDLMIYSACLCNRASAFIHLKRYKEAEEELKKAETLMNGRVLPLTWYRIYFVRVRYALGMGEGLQALAYIDSLEMQNIDAGGNLDQLQAEAYMLLGRFDEAADIYHMLWLDKDSTFTRDLRMQLDELNTLYKVDELNMQRQLDRSRFLIGLVVLVLVVLLLLGITKRRSSRCLEREHQLLRESNEKLEQSYADLQVANIKAEESSTMKSNFIRQISHEIRTPLNILSGFTQVITEPGAEFTDQQKSDIKMRIAESSDRIASLVNKMLELSEASSQAVIELKDDVQTQVIVLDAVEEASLEALSSVDFRLQMAQEDGSVTLHTNQQQAVRALVLLLDNAQKFTTEGTITLTVERRLADSVMAFVVEDTGIGIPHEEAEHIFEEFVQLDEYCDGTGIGLTVARSIARRMGGDITLDTSYHSGARFVMMLPL